MWKNCDSKICILTQQLNALQTSDEEDKEFTVAYSLSTVDSQQDPDAATETTGVHVSSTEHIVDAVSETSFRNSTEPVKVSLKVPPVPMPRLSLLKKNVSTLNARCNSEPSCKIYESIDASPRRPPRRKSDCPVPPISRTIYLSVNDPLVDCRKVIENDVEVGEHKKYFHSVKLRKFGNILRSKKFLSLRKSHKAKDNFEEEVKPNRPKRTPPLPPRETHFKPPAPLPIYDYDEECGEDIYEDGSSQYSQTWNDTELYATVGESSDSADHYEDLSDYERALEPDSDEDLYQDAFQCRLSNEGIYEVLPGDEHFNAKATCEPNLFVQSDNYCRKRHSNCDFERKLDKKEKKRALRAAKLRKKFNLTGEEIPVNAGVVIEDSRGSGDDLLVNKGEVVLIMRMESNPPGKWLVKNERGKIGYVDLQNIDVDPESIKSVMKIPVFYQR